MVFFSQKSWWKYDIYWSLKSSCFDHFGNGKYGLFLIQKVDGKIIFTDYWKVLVLNFSVLGNTGFFWVTKLMERWYLLVPEKFLFWTFRWWEIQPFVSQKVGGKMAFTWSFWAFHDIPGLERYGLSCSEPLCVFASGGNCPKLLYNIVPIPLVLIKGLKKYKMETMRLKQLILLTIPPSP